MLSELEQFMNAEVVAKTPTFATPDDIFEIASIGLPWLELQFPFEVPYKEMLEEARNVKERMVEHRGNCGEGWCSIALHGLEENITDNHKNYGWTDDNAPYIWTKAAEDCPTTKNFFQNVFGYDKYLRVRFMLLKPNGYILPHSDNDLKRMTAINMALNMPKGCRFRMEQFGDVPFKDGNSFWLDVGNRHALINESNQDRFHIIVHGHPNRTNDLWRLIYQESFKVHLEQQQSELQQSLPHVNQLSSYIE